MPKLILGLAGEMACGKGAATEYLVKKHQAQSLRFSTILRDVLTRLGLEQSRDNLQVLSTVLRQNFKEDLFAKVIAEDAKQIKGEIVIIDGVRRLADIKYLKELPEFKLAYIETDIRSCYERIMKRRENADDAQKTFEEFQASHQDECELQIKNLKNQADIIINNNGPLDELQKQLDKIINENFS